MKYIKLLTADANACYYCRCVVKPHVQCIKCISPSQSTLNYGNDLSTAKTFESQQMQGSAVIILYTVNQWKSTHILSSDYGDMVQIKRLIIVMFQELSSPGMRLMSRVMYL